MVHMDDGWLTQYEVAPFIKLNRERQFLSRYVIHLL